MTTTTPEPVAHPKDFAVILTELSRGRTVNELSHELAALIGKCQATGKKGQLVLTIEVRPIPGDTRQLVLADQIKVKAPEHDRAPTQFYLDRDGKPTRDDPEQASLFDRIQPPPAAPNVIQLDRTSVVNTTTGEVSEED